MDEFYERNREFFTPENKDANKIKAGIMTYAPSVILSLILLAMSGIGTLLQFNFSFQEVVWTTFLISLGLRLLSNTLSKYVGSNLSYNKALFSNEMQKIKHDFILSGENINREEFEKYVNQYNLEKKKEAYKTKKRAKIQILKTKLSALMFANNLYSTKRRLNKIDRLKTKIEKIKSISSDEYIDENIIYIKVKYKKVKSYYFLSPAEDYIDDSIRYRVNFARENTKEIIKSLPLTISFAFFSSLLAYDAVMGNINAVSILFDIATMIFNFTIGWITIGKKIASKTMNAYINRQSFLLEFKAKTKN